MKTLWSTPSGWSSVFDGIKKRIVADPPAYLKEFLDILDNLYSVRVFGGTRISEQPWQLKVAPE